MKSALVKRLEFITMTSTKKHLKKSSILKLQTEFGLLEGHDQCAAFLENQVEDLLLNPATVDKAARDCMLNEGEQLFTALNNALPSMEDVKVTLANSNLLQLLGQIVSLLSSTVSAGKG